MPSLAQVARSSVGKKLINGLTGLLLCGFIASHLTGNLLLLLGDNAFNEYGAFLHEFLHGYFIVVAEVGLVFLFGFHAWAGIQVALDRRRARPSGYQRVGNAGGASKKSLASRSMILTGIVLLVFVILHVAMFRFGVGAGGDYTVVLDGETHRDLYGLVVDWFKVGPVVAAYVAVMLLLGAHLRHGFWSAWQSLGANNPKYMPLIHAAGILFALAMTIGFLILPIYIYLFVDPVGASHMAAG